MNKRKLLPFIIVFLVLIGFLIGRFQFNKNKLLNIQFNLTEINKPDEIRIIENNRNCVLKKTTEGWMVNDLSKAKDLHVEFMLEKLKLLKMNFPASKQEKIILKDTLSNFGRTIELLHNGKKIYNLCFMEYRGKNIALNRKQIPYYVVIPGNSLMSLQKLIPIQSEAWMKNILIDITKENISSLNLTYPLQIENSFSIQQDEYGAFLIANHQKELIKNAESLEIQDYLSFYKGITYSLYHQQNYSLSNNYFFDLTIVDKDSNTIRCEGYKLYLQEKEDYDQNHCGIILNKKDTVIVRYVDIDPLLVEKDYFLKK